MRPARASLRAALAALLVALAPLPAAAHRLKVFATVEGDTVSGYAFFIGGGRPGGAQVTFRDAAGKTLGAAVTDADGAFAFTPARPEAITVVVDAGDGHAAEVALAADRFASAAATVAPAAGDARPGAPSAPASGASVPAALAGVPAAACDPAALAALVDTAVARQVRPLLEAQSEAEGRVRFNDVMGGIGMIVGLAGAALWASARRARAPGGG
ncbi:cobalamin biosynthesis protein CbiM [Xanthobacter tagetidis]|uniref:cobalamin biosynthesis protein CbiM n=1 Tax=Xanthobacter tagetidis TaxID=60216 RepID=UPI0017EE3590|nr:cobalamin biosynthesis protein CbiM [Xanthobacter tagetidis]MBB6307585.1 nickel transport protein [Xanthobacter tagetidis]